MPFTLHGNTNLNAIPWDSVEWTLSAQINKERTVGGALYQTRRGVPLWRCSLESVNMSLINTARSFESAYAAVENLYNRGLAASMYHPEPRMQRTRYGFAGSAITIATIAANRTNFTVAGTDLSTTGASRRLAIGDLIGVTVSDATGERYLHRVVEDYYHGTSDGIYVSPGLNLNEIVGSSIVLYRPMCNFIVESYAAIPAGINIMRLSVVLQEAR